MHLVLVARGEHQPSPGHVRDLAGASRADCCSAVRSAQPLVARSSSRPSNWRVERLGLRRPLHLDEATVAGHDDVHVGVRGRVRVVQVEDRLPLDDADADGGDRPGQRPGAGRQQATLPRVLDRVDERHVGAGDGRGPGPAVGLEDVTVEDDGVLPQRLGALQPTALSERPTSREISWVRAPG